MPSETYIIFKKTEDLPNDISFELSKGPYYYSFYIETDLWEMQEFLSQCKINTDISDIFNSDINHLLALAEELGLKEYIIEYEHDFAGQPDENGFIIPILNGKIMNKYIVDEENKSFLTNKKAYKLIGIDFPFG